MAGSADQVRSEKKNRDAWGILCLVIAILILLSFISHTPLDPSSGTASGETPQNWISRFGSYASDILLSWLGYAAYLIPIILIYFSAIFFSGRSIRFRSKQVFGYVIFFTGLCSLLAILYLPYASPKVLFTKGGLLGGYLADYTYDAFGKPGGITIFLALILMSFVFTVDFTFRGVFGGLKKLVVFAGGTIRKGASLLAGALESIKWPGRKPVFDDLMEPLIHDNRTVADRTEPIDGPEIEDQEEEDDFSGAGMEGESAEPSDEPLRPIVRKKEKPDKGPKIKERADLASPPEQIEFQGFRGTYYPPPIELLEDYRGKNLPVDREALLASSHVLEKKLDDFGVKGRVSNVHPGPIITMYEFEPAPGIKVNRVAALEDDLALVLRAESVRIIAPIPGKGAVGIEVPNVVRETIYLRELIESRAFQAAESPLSVGFGKDINGYPVVHDLTKMPHLLVAGTTGSGKSVFINTIITSIIYKASPKDVKLILIDPKMLELSDYAGIPHLLCPVCTQPKKASAILRWAVSEMESRYHKLAALGVRNIANYNKKVERMSGQKEGRRPAHDREDEPLETLPYIVVIVDELADLMMIAAKDFEEAIARLAQMARAAGIHLLLATQRPSVDVVSGVIKANFPARVSFKVSTNTDSRTILDTPGAQLLLGNGDMLFLPPTTSQIVRIHGCWISEQEVQAVVEHLKHQGTAQYDPEVINAIETEEADSGVEFSGDEVDPEFDKAVELIARERKASVSYIQRRLKIGYNRAARIMEMMEREGMVGPSDGTSRPREVLIPPPRNYG